MIKLYLKNFLKPLIIGVITFEAKLMLRRHRPKVIGVSGSVGKTSTKEAIAVVMASQYQIRKSAKSYNSDFGVPLTILNLKTGWSNFGLWLNNIIWGAYEVVFSRNFPEWLVLEVGADKPGEIKAIAKWLPCNIAVLTAFPDNPVHVEFFSSDSALFEEDLQLAYKLNTSGQTVANGDDKNILKYLPNLKGVITTVGFGKNNDWQSSSEVIEYNQNNTVRGIGFTIKHNNESYQVHLPGLIGGHQIYAILTALAVGELNGISPEQGVQALANFVGPAGRLRVIPGIKETTIIDDTYNASPAAMEAGLMAMSKIKTKGRRIAVLADMLELGDRTIEAHRSVGEHVGTICDLLLTVGLRSKFVIEGAKERGMKDNQIFSFDDSVQAGRKLQELLKVGDLVFVKGSQSMRMEKVVAEVMLEPNRREELLCRQETIWQDK
ncbi:MAG: UDP-N-acetylmuramoyl-tripeptide--D-alanyl-D-alanine ligase [Candidatus Vogelbacteria bacterium]|nr:UDP-N-acetylmuramoyl-tripeptide--D-alanyl-D-alanine ligase [Candidatus Vogelbacteria bacterium]